MHLAIVISTEEKVFISVEKHKLCLVMFLGLLEDAVRKINQCIELKTVGQKE